MDLNTVIGQQTIQSVQSRFSDFCRSIMENQKGLSEKIESYIRTYKPQQVLE